MAWGAVLGAAPPFLVELRPVYTDAPPQDWGIRSAKLLIDEDGRHLTADAPVVRVTPELLATAPRVSIMDDEARLRLKTWMGRRYDRPAVPEEFMALVGALKKELGRKSLRMRADRARDVLARFESAADGSITYELVAVLPGDPDPEDPTVVATREWLSAASLKIPRELGTARLLEAYGDEVVSLAFIEHCHSLQLSDVSWPRGGGGPQGAV